MDTKHTASHWGAIKAKVEGGRLVGVEPFDRDRNPSPIIGSMAGAVYDQTRILHPMVRAGYLAKSITSDRSRRGAEPFVQLRRLQLTSPGMGDSLMIWERIPDVHTVVGAIVIIVAGVFVLWMTDRVRRRSAVLHLRSRINGSHLW